MAFVPLDPAAAAQQALADCDADGNGMLDEKELDKAPGLKSALTAVDANGDKKLSAEEIAARLQTWQARNQARRSVGMRFTLDGKLLADAEVTLRPEPFLGSGFPTATAKTASNGIAFPSVDGQPGKGVPLGMYRVEVRSATAKLPDRYNTATTLGYEISPDNGTQVPEFALKSK